jgi:hypothetical protein
MGQHNGVQACDPVLQPPAAGSFTLSPRKVDVTENKLFEDALMFGSCSLFLSFDHVPWTLSEPVSRLQGGH